MSWNEGKTIRLAFPVFNRATFSRLKSLLIKLSRRREFQIDLIISSTLAVEEFEPKLGDLAYSQEGLKVHKLPFSKTSFTHLSMLEDVAEITASLGKFLSTSPHPYDAVVVTGDRYETLAAAQAAAFLNITLIHIQGGEITGNIDEKVRHAVTKLSDYHFVSTELSKRYVIRMGEERQRTFHTGCPSLDLIKMIRCKRRSKLENNLICIFQPETDVKDHVALEQVQTVYEAVLRFCKLYKMRCDWYMPNPDPNREGIAKFLDEYLKKEHIYFDRVVNVDPETYLKDLANSQMIVGNSSSGIRESSMIGVPAINVGYRQSIRERSYNVKDVGFDADAIIAAMKEQFRISKYIPSYLYGDGSPADKMITAFMNIDFSKKGPLNYPLLMEFKRDHFGTERPVYRKKRKYGRVKIEDSSTEHTHLQIES